MPQFSGKMPSIKQVAQEWEDQATIREHVRRHKVLLDWQDWDAKKINIKNADLNYGVLKPLASRMRTDTGDVGMHSLPSLEKQTLGGLIPYTFLTFLFARGGGQGGGGLSICHQDPKALCQHGAGHAVQGQGQARGEEDQSLLSFPESQAYSGPGLPMPQFPETDGHDFQPRRQ